MLFAYGTFWIVSLYYPVAETMTEPYVKEAVGQVEDLVKEYVPPSISISTYVPTAQVLVWTILLSLEAYLYSSCFLGVTYFFTTSARRVVKQSNELRESISTKTNDVLRQAGILFFCRDILQIRMGRTKRKLLKLINYSYKLDMLREVVDGDTGSVATGMTSISSFSPYSSSPPPKPSAPPAPTTGSSEMIQNFTAGESISNRWQNTFSSWRGRASPSSAASVTKTSKEGNIR
jgi:hypothetical protein